MRILARSDLWLLVFMSAALSALGCGGGDGGGGGGGGGGGDTGAGAYFITLNSSGLGCVTNASGLTAGADLWAARMPPNPGDEVRLFVYMAADGDCSDFDHTFYFTATSAMTATEDGVSYYFCHAKEGLGWGDFEMPNATLTVTDQVSSDGLPTSFTVQGPLTVERYGTSTSCSGTFTVTGTHR